jgi:hypothetical protein
MFWCVPWSRPREYPHFKRPMAFLAIDCRASREATRARYLFYSSTKTNGRACFRERRTHPTTSCGPLARRSRAIERRLESGDVTTPPLPTQATDRRQMSACAVYPSPATDPHRR